MSYLDELIKQKKMEAGIANPVSNTPVLDDNGRPYTNQNDLPTLISAGAIGAGNMLNNTILGGLGQLLGGAGAIVETVSPFSGSRDDERLNLIRAGVPYETAAEAYPDEDSWVTSLGKGLLGVNNTIGDYINDYRNQVLGDNPTFAAQVAEGSGSSLGFMGAGLAAGLASKIPLLGAIVAGGMEALSESGGTLADAYRHGQYDNGGLAAANKSLVTNAVLNSALNAGLGMFAKHNQAIRNPITRFLSQTGEQVVNELLQEPSQQVIEKATARDIYNNEDFLPALADEAKEWPKTALELAPTVAASTLLTQGLMGAAGVAHPGIRQDLHDQYRNRKVDIEETKAQLARAYQIRDDNRKLLDAEIKGDNRQAWINRYIKRERQLTDRITKLKDDLKPEKFTYEPQKNPDNEAVMERFVSLHNRNGNPATVLSPVYENGKPREYKTHYKVVEADDLIPSHTDNLAINPKYTIKEAQNRLRNDEASINQIETIAMNLDSRLLGESQLISEGSPIITPDGMVVAGNGRTLGIRKAYKNYKDKAQKYKADIYKNSRKYGLKREEIANMKQPVLVRVLDSDVDVEQFGKESNTSNLLTLNASENAAQDSKGITAEMLKDYDSSKPLESNRDFLSAFMSTLSENERSVLTNKGVVKDEGIKRAKNAIVAKAFGNNPILKTLTGDSNPESKNLANALIEAAPAIAKMQAVIEQQSQNKDYKEGEVRKDLLIGNDIAEAASRLEDYRNRAKKPTENGQKLTVRDMLNQPSLDTLGESEEVHMIMEFFEKNKASEKKITQGLQNYAALVEQQPEPGQATLFNEGLRREKKDLLAEALKTDGEETQEVLPAPKKRSRKNNPQLNNEQNSNAQEYSQKALNNQGNAIQTNPTEENQTDANPAINQNTVLPEGEIYNQTEGITKQNSSAKPEAITANTNQNQNDEIKTQNDGYIGDIDTGTPNDLHSYSMFLDDNNGNPYVDFSDDDGNSVAVYDFKTKKIHIRPDHEQDGRVKQLEDDFKRELGANPEENILKRHFKQKAIDAGVDKEVAEAVSSIYVAANKYFARGSKQSLYNVINKENLNIEGHNTEGNNGDKGSVAFNEAQTLMKLFKNADKSTLLHETAHTFFEKFMRFGREGMFSENTQAARDWGVLRREYGLEKIDFSKELSAKDKAKIKNAHEKFAAGFEKYLMKGEAPKSKLRQVFESFKNWLKEIYTNLRGIKYTDANGKQHEFNLSKDVRKVFDNMMSGAELSATKLEANAQERIETAKLPEVITPENKEAVIPEKIADTNETPIQKETQEKDTPNQRKFVEWLKRIKNTVGESLFNVAHVQKPANRKFDIRVGQNDEIERKWQEAGQPVKHRGIIGTAHNAAKEIVKSIKGDYPELSHSPRAKELNLYKAQEFFRNADRQKKKAVIEAMRSFADNLRGLDATQLEIFGKTRLLQDLAWRAENNPDAVLPFGLTHEQAKSEAERFSKIAEKDKAVKEAIENEEKTMQNIARDFIEKGKKLGLDFSPSFKNPHYYRHMVLEYANATNRGRRYGDVKGNQDIQSWTDATLQEITGRGWFKKYRGYGYDISTDYIRANAETRAGLLQDSVNLDMLIKLKEDFDIAPKLREAAGKQKTNIDTTTFSQSGEKANQSENGKTEAMNIPDGYDVIDPATTRLIESNKTIPENLFRMALDDVAKETGINPSIIDSLFDSYIAQDEASQKRMLVLPSEVVEVLRRKSRARARGTLSKTAKELTTWWKKTVLFSPTRNLKYNFRNFTGDLDALIAGNPHALTKFTRSVKNLTDFFLHNGEEGFNIDPDLKDYIDRSEGLGVLSLGITQLQAKSMSALIKRELAKSQKAENINDKKELGNLKRSEKANAKRLKALQEQIMQEQGKQESKEASPGKIKKTIDFVKMMFDKEVEFTAWREHLLRYAAYLDYKEQMQKNKDGKPNNWGASLEEEVISLNDIKDRAFKMSNELIGAYDQVSEVGKQLRDMLVPFYSWMEVNMKRYYRLIKNGFKGGNQSEVIKQILKGKTARVPFYTLTAADALFKISAFTLATQLFNRFVTPDADDDLPDKVKYRPHLTFGKAGGQVYYFDRIGALADALDWVSLDSFALDAKDITNGQQSIGGYLKKVIQAPISKAINGLNPGIKMPIELAMGRSMFPDVFHPSTIKDPAKYIAQSLGMSYPYKLATGEPHSTAEELVNLGLYSLNPDEAAYWQTLDKVRQYQNNVLDKHFDGFASTQRGRILQKLKLALRYDDKQKVREYLREYAKADGTKQGLKQSMKAMNPLHGLNEKEKKDFLKWLTPSDRKYLRKAERYWHQLADKYMK
ncbi:MAG: hypothetical protein IJQ24_08330 [Synergistaceae bacterium]|nr:hypothetical protein [Synergistaceae bacterium]